MNAIKTYEFSKPDEFDTLISKNVPFIISNANFGQCLHKWNEDYLSQKLNDYQVKVHVSNDSILNFICKNFKYETYDFSDFLDKCKNSAQYLYLRSIGNDKRGKEISNISKQFPSIAEDILYPDCVNFCSQLDSVGCQCEKKHLFSSVFRISSKDLVLWTHYDILDNILLQIKGSKRVILFPPDDAPFLSIKGDKSEITDLDDTDIESKFPSYKFATKYECLLNEGDALFIPALWFHNTKSLEFSIGVNFFWKSKLLEDFYNKSDVYGNKDLIPATDAYANIDKAIKHLSKLPEKYKKFYLNMIIAKLNKELSKC